MVPDFMHFCCQTNDKKGTNLNLKRIEMFFKCSNYTSTFTSRRINRKPKKSVQFNYIMSRVGPIARVGSILCRGKDISPNSGQNIMSRKGHIANEWTEYLYNAHSVVINRSKKTISKYF